MKFNSVIKLFIVIVSKVRKMKTKNKKIYQSGAIQLAGKSKEKYEKNKDSLILIAKNRYKQDEKAAALKKRCVPIQYQNVQAYRVNTIKLESIQTEVMRLIV
jgi:hypothetical protein